MDRYYHILLIALICVLIIGMLFGLIRSILGPRRADRILGINMIGSLSTTALAVLSVLIHENWLLDVCLIYCLISFLAVIVLAKIHISEAIEERGKEEKK